MVCTTLALCAAAGPSTHEELISRVTGWTGLGRTAFVSVKPDMAVAIVRRDGADRASGVVRNIELHGEVTNEAAAGEFGYRSIRSQVDVDCSSRRDRVVRVDLFADHNLTGRSQTRRGPGGWAHPSPDAYLADVIDAVCAPASATLRLAAEAPASPSPAAPSVAPPRPPQAQVIRVAAQATPGAQGVTPAPAVPATVTRSAPRSAAPAVINIADATAVRAPAPAPTRAPPPKAAPVLALALGPGVSIADSGVVAQIAASASASGAAQALRGVRGRLAPGLSASVAPATVNGRQVYRAIVQGFASRSQANAFCSAQEKAGEDCFVR